MTVTAHGTLLKRGNGGSPETFTTIAEVRDIDGPNLKSNMKDVTHHSSGGYDQFFPTTQTMGQIKFQVALDLSAATHSYSAGIIKDWYNKTLRNFQVVFPLTVPVTWSFAAYVESVSMKEAVKGEHTADIVLQVSGAPTLA